MDVLSNDTASYTLARHVEGRDTTNYDVAVAATQHDTTDKGKDTMRLSDQHLTCPSLRTAICISSVYTIQFFLGNIITKDSHLYPYNHNTPSSANAVICCKLCERQRFLCAALCHCVYTFTAYLSCRISWRVTLR